MIHFHLISYIYIKCNYFPDFSQLLLLSLVKHLVEPSVKRDGLRELKEASSILSLNQCEKSSITEVSFQELQRETILKVVMPLSGR